MTTTIGTSGDDTIAGGDGNDVIVSGKGDDTVDGGEGSDVVNAGQGDDTLIYTYVSSDVAKDIYIGGAGADTLLLYISQGDADASSLAEQIAAFSAKLAQAGGTATPTFTFTFANGSTLTISTIEQITLNYTNSGSPPVLADIAAATYIDTQGDDAFSATSGTLTCSHLDAGKTPTYGIDGGSTATITVLGGIGYDISQASSYGTLYLNSSTGQYRFEPLDAALEGLKASQVLDFTFTLSDGTSTTSKTFSITLAGVNDTPELAAVTPGALTDTAADDSFADITDILAGSDRDDVSNALSYGIQGGTAGSFNVGTDTYQASMAGAYGTLYLDTSTGAYRYVANDAAVEALKAGAADAFTFTVSDGNSSSTTVFTVNLAGANDTPELAVPTTTPVAEGSNAAAQDIAPVSGDLIVSDRDIGDTLTASVVDTQLALSGGGALTDAQQAALMAALASGKLLLGSAETADGGMQLLSFTWDPTAANLDFLNVDQSLTITYTIQLSDGTSSASEQLQFTITGTNDAPTDISFTAADWTSGNTLPGSGSTIATLSADDPDSGDSITYTFTATGNGALVNNGATFTLSGADLSTSGLAQGTTYVLEVRATDELGAYTTETLRIYTGLNNGSTASNTLSSSTGDDTIYTLSSSGANIDIVFAGSGNDTVFGQGGVDELHGEADDDVLYGGAGNDVLTGGSGADTFVFDSALSASANVDQITDFTVGSDTIRLSTAAGSPFSVLAGMTAADAWGTYVIYDQATGNLSFDADGAGAGGAIRFAELTDGTALTASDLLFT